MRSKILLASGILLLAGCGGSDGPELIDVSGVVTMDGSPLANASVGFLPLGEGVGGTSPSYALTDEDGHYVLQYSLSRDGALPGKYKVQISSHQVADPDASPPVEAQAEVVPIQYNRETTLEIDVPSDSYDFALKSEGEIYQPASDDEDDADD
jgi:hypothetical protein